MIPRQFFNILCVDDDVAVLKTIKAALEASGYDVETAQNGFAALQRVSQSPDSYQLIVTDIRMPGMSGVELIERTQASGYLGRYIVFAAQITPDVQQRLKELRVTRVIDKPGRIVDLISAIREAQSAF